MIVNKFQYFNILRKYFNIIQDYAQCNKVERQKENYKNNMRAKVSNWLSEYENKETQVGSSEKKQEQYNFDLIDILSNKKNK